MSLLRSLLLLALVTMVGCYSSQTWAQEISDSDSDSSDATAPSASPVPSATSVAGAPCTTSGGVAININGNHGFCYLVGHRMRPGSVYAQCKDGVLTCYEDEGIPDKPKKEVECVAPEAGKCKSAATPASSTNTTSAASEGRSADAVALNPSAMVSGNLDVPGLDE